MRSSVLWWLWSFFAFCDALMTLGSVFLLRTGEVLSGISGILFFGVLGASTLYQFRPTRANLDKWFPSQGGTAPAPRGDQARPVHGTLPGADRYTPYTTGLIFAASRRALVMPLAGTALFAGIGVMMLFANTAAGVITIVLVLGFAVMACGPQIRPGGIALLPEGVYLRTPGGRAWVRWDDLDRVYLSSMGPFGSYIAFLARSPEAVELTGFNGWGHGIGMNRFFGMDVSYATQLLGGDSRDLFAYIDHYRRVPAARPWLADPGLGRR